MPPEEPLQDPWVDPVTALSAGFGGALPRALGRVGTEGIKALAGPVVSGLASGLMDYPVGTLTEMVGQKYPKAALPANIALGLASGLTFERLAEEAMEDPRAAINYAKGLLADDAGYITFHGTPHQWTPEPGFPHGRPRLDKIGTGEGAQAYGYGWYSAEADNVAKTYQKLGERYGYVTDKNGNPIDNDFISFAMDHIGENRKKINASTLKDEIIRLKRSFELRKKNAEKDGFKHSFDKDIENADRAIEVLNTGAIVHSGGALYKLDIPDDISDKLLDWDKPLSEQPNILKKLLDNGVLKEDGQLSFMYNEYPKTGRELYERLTSPQASSKFTGGHGDKAASEYLASIGIPGNKYLDGVSRGQGKGSYNYVLWDQPTLDRVKVLQRNNETLDPIGNSIAELNQADPTHKLKFDGIQEGFGTIPSKYQITPQDGPAKGATFLVDQPTQEAIGKRLAEMIDMRNSDASNFVKVYRGEYQGNKGGKYWTPDVEFSRNFTQSGRDDEIFQSFVNKKDIYIPESPVYAGDPDAIKSEISKARRKGLKAIELDEGEGQPKSIYVFDDKALKSKKKYEN